MKYTIYILIILCGILPVVFKRTWWIRSTSIIILIAGIVFYMMNLQTSSRLASIKEYNKTEQSPSEEWMAGAMKTRLIVQQSHPMGLLLFTSLIILALKPIKEE